MTTSSSPFVHEFFETVTSTCQFIVADTATLEAVIIDPVLDFNPASGQITTQTADQLIEFIQKNNYKIKFILETHAHADHLTSSQYLKQKLGSTAKVCIGEGIKFVQQTFAQVFNLKNFQTDGSQFDHLWKDQEVFSLGNLKCKVIHTPGHTNDSVSYLIGDSVFTGDSIFMPDVGTARCDFPGGNAETLFGSIQKLLNLPETTKVFVGHDYPPESRTPSGQTTVLQQKRENKHVKEGTSLEDFSKWRSDRDKNLGAPRLLYPSIQVNIRAGKLPDTEENDSIYFKIPIKSEFKF